MDTQHLLPTHLVRAVFPLVGVLAAGIAAAPPVAASPRPVAPAAAVQDGLPEFDWARRPFRPGSEPFLEAVRNGDLETVSKLLEERRELLDAGDEEGRSVFVLASTHGQQNVCDLLLRKGYMLDVVDAVLIPDWGRVGNMLDADPGRVNEYHPIGGTVLYAAAKAGTPQLWRLLLRGADPNANPRGTDGVTAAMGAVECEEPLAAYLGAIQLFGSGGDVNAPQREGRSALHVAAARGHEPLVRYLLRCGAHVDARDAEGKTPLDRARESGSTQVVELLENHESVPRDSRTSRFAIDKDGNPIELPDLSNVPRRQRDGICRGALADTTRVSKALKNEPRLVYTRSSRDELAIETAARGGRHDIVRLLLDHGAPMSLPVCAMLGEVDRARELLEADPGRAHERASLDYPVMWFPVIGRSGVESARVLLEHGTPVDQESGGTTALHWAAREGDIAMAKFLLENGARLDAVGYTFSRQGKTPIEVARTQKQARMVEFLEQWEDSGD